MTPSLYIEFKEESVHAVAGEKGLELPLAREASGRMTAAALEKAAAALREFVAAQGRPGRTAYCSIPARGVSLRRLAIPAAANGEAARLLPLQLEAQLPVAPAELAWGFERVGGAGARNGSGEGLAEFLVVAVRKQFLEDYEKVVRQAGLEPQFHVGALARVALCQKPAGRWSMAEIDPMRAELTVFDERGPVAVRTLDLKESGAPETGGRLFLSAADSAGRTAAAQLAARWQRSAASEMVAAPEGTGWTAANAGLRKLVESGGARLALDGHEAAGEAIRTATPWKWAIAAGVLLLLALALRYAEAGIYRGRLERQLKEATAYRQTLPNLDRELSFLQYIKTNQPPYLEAMSAVAAAAPQGTRVDALSLVRRGELSVRGSVQDPQGPANFRNKLIDSGFFTRVVIEDQTPVDNNQKMNFRLSAQVKPEGMRPTAGASTNAAPSATATNAVPTR